MSSRQKNRWIFIEDTLKHFAIRQSEPKMQQVFGEEVKVSLPQSYHSADAKKEMVLVFKGVSSNVTLEEFKELLDFNKITNAEAERMKSKRTGRDLPFLKITCDNPKQAEALISGGSICQKTGIIFKVEEFRITPSIQQCFKCQGFGDKALNRTKNRHVLCVVKLIRTKIVQTTDRRNSKKCLGVNIEGKDVFESIISQPAPLPAAPFVFSSTLVEKKKAVLKASTVLNKAALSLAESSSHSTKSTETPSLGSQRKSSSKLSVQQNKTTSKPSPNKPTT